MGWTRNAGILWECRARIPPVAERVLAPRKARPGELDSGWFERAWAQARK